MTQEFTLMLSWDQQALFKRILCQLFLFTIGTLMMMWTCLIDSLGVSPGPLLKNDKQYWLIQCISMAAVDAWELWLDHEQRIMLKYLGSLLEMIHVRWENICCVLGRNKFMWPKSFFLVAL